MRGVIKIADQLPIGGAVEELVTFVACSRDDEWDGQAVHLPL